MQWLNNLSHKLKFATCDNLDFQIVTSNWPSTLTATQQSKLYNFFNTKTPLLKQTREGHTYVGFEFVIKKLII